MRRARARARRVRIGIVAFAMLVFALVATYELQARAAGVLGVIGLGAAILGTVFMAGDWWYEAFAVPRLAEVAPQVMNTFARSRLLVGGLTSFVLFGIGWDSRHTRGDRHVLVALGVLAQM